jgi:hypothetical protein
MAPFRINHPAAYTTIKGQVRDKTTLKPISGVAVKIYREGRLVLSTTTDNVGNYYIKKKSLWGSQDIKFSKSGYNTGKVRRSLKYGKTYNVNFYLASRIPVKPNVSPRVGVTVPLSGVFSINQPVSFTANYTDSDGYGDIKEASCLINTTSTVGGGVYLKYDQSARKVYLRNDTGTTWVGGYVPGTDNIIETSRLKLNCAQTSVSGIGNELIINWNVTFKNEFSGTKNVYLSVKDQKGLSTGWVKGGSYTITNSPPANGEVSPQTSTYSSDQSGYFTTTYLDDNGYKNLRYCYFTIGEKTDDIRGFIGKYDANRNKLYLKDVNRNQWDGGYEPGLNTIIENRYMKLDCSKTTVIGEGNTLTIRWHITFNLPCVGKKNLYLSVGDDYNSTADWEQKGTCEVLLNMGEWIGPDGGEVKSPDGKVILEIPAGALDFYQRITISTVDKEVLAGLISQDNDIDGDILRAVECKPYDLEFNEGHFPTLTYIFDEVQNSGTEVVLGLYDSSRNEFDFSDEISAVVGANENDRVSFAIEHFSTYAAIKTMVPTGAPIGGGVQIPLPDMFTGAFSHSVSIAIPPGRKGMQPNVSLTYRSSNGNSWVGVGLSLNPGHIIRSTRLGPPTYNDTQDTFYFVSEAGTTELVHLVDNLYQAKIESSFTKFFKEADDSWKIVSKDGSQLEFGKTDNSREKVSDEKIYSWYLTKAIDTNQNYIEYQYTKDEGKCYLREILYTGHPRTLPKNTVKFFLEDREDISSSYISTSKIATTKRLKEILVKCDGEIVWTYKLEYTNSPDTDRSLLECVRQYAGDAADNKQLPVQGFEYQSAE